MELSCINLTIIDNRFFYEDLLHIGRFLQYTFMCFFANVTELASLIEAGA
jgi:hypothetical protein